MARRVVALLLITAGCLPLAYGVCVPTMGMSCVFESLNMLTDGTATLRQLEPNRRSGWPTIRSGPFLSFVSEFFDNVEFETFREPVFAIQARTNLSKVQVYDAKALKQLQIADGGDIGIQELTLYNCGLDRIPVTIGNLPLLDSLTLYQCALRNVSLKAFAKNTRLTSLDLSFNEIDTIMPLAVADSDIALAIENLYLTSNRLENLDMTAFDGLSRLVMLDLRYNNLAKVAAERTITWPMMEIFDVSNNQLRTLDLQWLSAPNLKRLLLSNNLLDKIPARLRRFPRLQLVGLADNQFAGIDLAPLNGLPTLNSLDFSNNPKTRYIRSSRPIRLPELDSLYVEFCSVSRFNTSGIELPVVSFISLAHNNFSTIPPLGLAFPSITSFSLYNNPIPCGTLKARSELILSGRLIMGPPQDAASCPSGSFDIAQDYAVCCKA
uniref:Uncharacterized protein n=1 Tax=Anopheles stephensi TaxID=30069 RepID=A0A182XYT8_ANOST